MGSRCHQGSEGRGFGRHGLGFIKICGLRDRRRASAWEREPRRSGFLHVCWEALQSHKFLVDGVSFLRGSSLQLAVSHVRTAARLYVVEETSLRIQKYTDTSRTDQDHSKSFDKRRPGAPQNSKRAPGEHQYKQPQYKPYIIHYSSFHFLFHYPNITPIQVLKCSSRGASWSQV